jgi:hypothetical protein
VFAHSAGYEGVPRVWPFNATEKLGPDVSELLSKHCLGCVLDGGEAQISQTDALGDTSHFGNDSGGLASITDPGEPGFCICPKTFRPLIVTERDR